ncbi:hypothetical protein QR685DRAFT_231759 [Neurospora intermedia]|uniref:Uncharacterized protein n=1 Tax=Neurospora intermedia TaxID=5142 RepID=A0ABR3DKJ8_NEUIN
MSTNNSTEDDEPKLPHGIVFQDIERTAGEEDDGKDKDQAETSARFGSLCWPNFSSTMKEGDADDNRSKKGNPTWYQKLIDAGIEENGIQPVPLQGRTSTQYNQLFTVFLYWLVVFIAVSHYPILRFLRVTT